MNKIEHEVRLPTGAHPLADYARYYALEDGRVHAVYLIPWGPAPELDDACAGAKSHDVGCEGLLHPLKAGGRRWLADRRDLPVMTEGGCSVVELDYDAGEGRVTKIACHLNA